MISPAAAYQRNIKERPAMKKEAYLYFNNKYFKDPFIDKGFLDSTERIKGKSIKQFIPGKIYTFRYDPVYKEILDFYDRRPIILCCGEWVAEGTGNRIVTGINLNFLPEIARVNTLEYYYNSVKGDLDQAYKITSETNQVTFIKRAIIVLQDIIKAFNIFNKAGKIGYQFAMRNYIVGQNMSQNVIVEYDDWEWIPFIQTKDIVGKSLSEIYKEYLLERKKLIQKQPPILRPQDKRTYNNRKG
jgi:hypothetical protein